MKYLVWVITGAWLTLLCWSAFATYQRAHFDAAHGFVKERWDGPDLFRRHGADASRMCWNEGHREKARQQRDHEETRQQQRDREEVRQLSCVHRTLMEIWQREHASSRAGNVLCGGVFVLALLYLIGGFARWMITDPLPSETLGKGWARLTMLGFVCSAIFHSAWAYTGLRKLLGIWPGYGDTETHWWWTVGTPVSLGFIKGAGIWLAALAVGIVCWWVLAGFRSDRRA